MWQRATFKDARVWAEVNDQGQLVVRGGRVAIRYSDREGAKVYRAASGRVSLLQDAEVRAMSDGVAADAARGATSTTGRRGSGFGKAGTRTQAQAAAAKRSATELLAELPEGTTVVFTDGASRGNPGAAGSGAVVQLPDGRRLEASWSLGVATNNVAELSAVKVALDLLDRAALEPDAPVAVLTDSDYTAGVLTRGWKAKANRDLITGLRERIRQRPGLAVHWVAGHVGLEGNERADVLANRGADGDSSVDELGAS